MATLSTTERALQDLASRLDRQLTPAIQGAVSNEAKAILKSRVFSRRLGTNKSIIGKYKNERYRKVNKKLGFNVDLQRTGDLFNSINVGKFGADIVLGYTNDRTLKYAKYNEVRYRNKENTIFALNEKESDEAFKAGQRAFDKMVDRWLQTF